MMRLLLRSYGAPVSNANLYKHSVPPGPNNSGHRQFTHCPEIVTTIAGTRGKITATNRRTARRSGFSNLPLLADHRGP